MAIDAKIIQLFVWKIVKFSMNSCYRFVQKHPFVSSVVLLFFLLYLLLPSVFFCLICSSPFMVCIYVYIRYYLNPKCPETKKDKRVDDEKSSMESKSLAADDAVVVSRNDTKPVIHDGQMSRRKNVNNEFDATPVDASIVGSQNAIPEEEGSASLGHGESSSSQNVSGVDNLQAQDQPDRVLESQPSMVEQTEKGNAAAGGGGRGGGEEEEESSDEEETQQGGNNAVEWTADDQQNLMDLGDSELERNKRLESLITRRRARKLFKMAFEKGVIESGSSGGQVPPISILRNNLLDTPNNLDCAEGLQIPGSAPSVLFPARNPFDIPYDPYEERPNLTGDSFHEEFSIHQRELLFCRHESFFLKPSFSLESQQDQHDSHFGEYSIERRTTPGLRLPRHRTLSDMSAHDQLIDDLLDSQEGESMSRNLSATDLVELESQSPKESKNSEESKHGMIGMEGEAIENSADRSEFQMDTDSTRNNSSGPCSLASDEASELSFHANMSSNIGNLVPKSDKHRQLLSDRVKSSPTFTIPEDIALIGPSYDSSSSALDKPRIDDHLFFFRDKMPCHSPGYSIASDLQVEVSDIGSPPLPIDGTMSPADIESSYDGDIDKDVTSGSEEMWGASCYLAGVDENESRSKEVNDVSVNDILEAGISAMKQNLQNQIASSLLSAQVAVQDKSNTSSLSSSRTGMQGEDHTHSKHIDNKVSENGQQVLEVIPKSFSLSHSLPPQIPRNASSEMKELVSHRPRKVSSKKPEELSNPPAEESAEVNANPEVDNQVEHASNEKDNLKSAQEMDGGSEISTNKNAIMQLSEPAENFTSASSNDFEKNCENPAKQETVVEPEGDPSELNEPEEVEISSLTTDVQDEQNTTEESAEVNVTPEVDDQVMHVSNEKDNLKSAEDMGGGSKISTNEKAIMHLSEPPENITSALINDIEKNFENLTEQQTVIKPKGDPPKLNEPEEVGSSSLTTDVQEEQNTTEESAEVNATPEVDDQVVHASNEKDDLKSAEEMGGGSEISTNKNALMNLSEPAENITSASNNDIEKNCENPAEQQIEIEPEGDPPELNEPEELGRLSLTTDVQDEQNMTEAGVSGVNQSVDNHIMSQRLLRILEADQISTISSSCSSPRSVLPVKNRRLSSASFDQQLPIQNDEPQSNLDDMVRNNSLDGMSTESVVRNNSLDDMSTESVAGSSSLDDMSTESVVRNNSLDDMSTDESVILVSAPENSQHLVADPIDLTSPSSGFRILEEPSAEIVEGTSEPVINLQATVLLSESVKCNPSKSEDNAADSYASGNMMKKEETSNSPAQSTIEADLTNSINHLENQKENKGKSVVGGESESKTVQSTIEADLTNSINHSVENQKEDKEKSVVGGERESKNVQSTIEADLTNSTNHSVENQKEDKEKSVVGGESESKNVQSTREADLTNSINHSVENQKEDKEKSVVGDESESKNVQSTIEADLTDSIDHSEENQKVDEGKYVVGSESESKNVEGDEAATEPSVPAAEVSVEKEPSDPFSKKPTAEACVVHNVNETVADQEIVSDELKTIETVEQEPDDAQVAIEQSRAIESEVNEAPNQANTAE